MTAVVQQKTSPDSPVSKPEVPPSVLLIGKKPTLDYVAPALYRINDTDELVIRATGSLSIVTAVDIAEIVKRDCQHRTHSITLAPTSSGSRLANSNACAASRSLIKVSPIAVAHPIVDLRVPVEESAASTVVVPIERATPAVVEVPVVVVEKAKKPMAKRKLSGAKKKSSKKRKKAASA